MQYLSVFNVYTCSVPLGFNRATHASLFYPETQYLVACIAPVQHSTIFRQDELCSIQPYSTFDAKCLRASYLLGCRAPVQRSLIFRRSYPCSTPSYCPFNKKPGRPVFTWLERTCAAFHHISPERHVQHSTILPCRRKRRGGPISTWLEHTRAAFHHISPERHVQHSTILPCRRKRRGGPISTWLEHTRAAFHHIFPLGRKDRRPRIN